MENITRLISFLITPIIVSGIIAWLRRPRQAEYGKVYLPKFFVIFGTIASALCLIPVFITALTDESIWLPIFFSSFSLLSASLIIAFVNCRITYDDDGFVSKNFFGIKRKFTYDQVTGIKLNVHDKYIFIGNRKVRIDEFSIGGKDFIELVKKKYRTLHNGQSVPKIYKTKHDIFNGNIKDSGGIVFADILIGVLAVGFLIFTICCVYFMPSNESNTIKQTIKFSYCNEKDDEIILRSMGNNIYKIRFIDEQFNSDDIAEICDGETTVTAYSVEVTPDDEDDYYSLKAIVCNDEYILSFDETNRLHSQEYSLMIYIASAACIIWGVIVAGSIVVGRNPQKFSKKVVRLFFKDGYIKH